MTLILTITAVVVLAYRIQVYFPEKDSTIRLYFRGIGDEKKPFREQYSQTKFLRSIFDVPTLCISATIDDNVLTDIKKNLDLEVSRNCKVIGIAPDRPNIFFDLKPGKISIEKAFSWIINGIRSLRTSFPKTVIFVSDPIAASELYESFIVWLSGDAYVFPPCPKSRLVSMYTGPIGRLHQDFVLESFRRSDSVLRVVICTVAFGMGMDIPDIRNVVHWGHCDKVVSYWQEVGRVGRDGSQSSAYIYPSSSSRDDVFKAFRAVNFAQCIRLYFLSKLCPQGVGVEYLQALSSRPSCTCNLASCQCSNCNCCSVCRGLCRCRSNSA